jgi:hypothetical protein
VFKFLGSCNDVKQELNMCLRQEVSTNEYEYEYEYE